MRNVQFTLYYYLQWKVIGPKSLNFVYWLLLC